MTDNKKTERTVAIVIHVCIWTYIFAFPLLYGRREESIDWLFYFQRLYFPISSCLVFYVNYFYFVPHLLLDEQRKMMRFLLLNVALICLLLFSREIYAQLLPPPEVVNERKCTSIRLSGRGCCFISVVSSRWHFWRSWPWLFVSVFSGRWQSGHARRPSWASVKQS